MTDTLTVVTAPGVYDMPETVYHADPVPEGSLSQSGAKLLLPPSTPAAFRWYREHGRPVKTAYEFGHAAHALVLGVGAPVRVIPDEVCAKDGGWSTAAAKAMVAEARANGETPLKPSEWAEVQAMAAALREHPVAAALLNPERGEPEKSMFWRDPQTGVWLRARVDFMPYPGDGRMLLADYKTTISAAPSAFAKSVANYGYHSQAPWYIDGVRALGFDDQAAFLFIAQEKTPPYLVGVYELPAIWLRLGRERNRRAIDTYAECAATDTWPGYSADVEQLDMPAWVARQHETEMQ